MPNRPKCTGRQGQSRPCPSGQTHWHTTPERQVERPQRQRTPQEHTAPTHPPAAYQPLLGQTQSCWLARAIPTIRLGPRRRKTIYALPMRKHHRAMHRRPSRRSSVVAGAKAKGQSEAAKPPAAGANPWNPPPLPGQHDTAADPAQFSNRTRRGSGSARVLFTPNDSDPRLIELPASIQNFAASTL
jgi:hypothetical protein